MFESPDFGSDPRFSSQPVLGKGPRAGAVMAVTLSGLICSAWMSLAVASMPLETVPSYQSTPSGHVATGGGFADVNRDGWLDMVVANGNDISRQRVSLYRNNGNGTFPLTPTWESSDIDYHGHLDLGDVNGDGYVDVVVSVYIGPAGFSAPGKAKLYLGNAAGTFSGTPVWTSPSFYTFSCALGDADGDGDLDLALATGESYTSVADRQKIFFNTGTTFENTPSWQSTELGYALDVYWDDYDRDGDLDVVFCGNDAPTRLYENGQTDGLGIATTATWVNADLPEYGNTSAFGDWNGDGYPELAIADNFQQGGNGFFKVYANNGGTLQTTPIWTSATGSYGSHVSWIDLDVDGDLDLATGGWWDKAKIFENSGGTLTTNPVWTGTPTSVIENMFWGDVDNDALFPNGGTQAVGDGLRTFFSAGQAPVRSIDAVRINGILQNPSVPAEKYCTHLANGWISFANPPADGDIVTIEFSYSTDLDLGVTTWDSGIGNHVYYNTTAPTSAPDPESSLAALVAVPNPVRNATQIRYRGNERSAATLAVYDAAGRHVRTLLNGHLEGGLRVFEWDRRNDDGRRVDAGVYFARLAAGTEIQSIRLVALD